MSDRLIPRSHTARVLHLWDCFELSSEEGSQCEKVPVFLERTGIGLIARGSSFRQPKQCGGVTPLHWSSAFHMEKCSQNSAPRLKGKTGNGGRGERGGDGARAKERVEGLESKGTEH